VLEERRPAHVERRRFLATGAVARRAARQVEFAQVRELADGLVEGLEGDAFRDEGQVENAEVSAFGERGPAVDGEGGLGRNEDLERGFGAA
jgi:hypothetical protein